MATAGNEFGKQVRAPTKHEGKKCLVLGDLIIRNVGPEHTNMVIKSFPGIRNEKLHRVMENRNLGSPDTVLHHVGKKDLRRTRHLDCVMENMYSLVVTVKSSFPECRLVLSGLSRRRNVTWL